jgi:hypothetical protein
MNINYRPVQIYLLLIGNMLTFGRIDGWMDDLMDGFGLMHGRIMKNYGLMIMGILMIMIMMIMVIVASANISYLGYVQTIRRPEDACEDSSVGRGGG